MALHAVTVFLSAFLLFQVQPLAAKAILPWFGGSPGVWTVCVLFFQLVLLLGYAYSHLLARRRSLRSQVTVHAAVVGLALLSLGLGWLVSGTPAGLPASLQPVDNAAPEWRIVLLLVTSVGFPYFVLTTTGPLLQAWWARTQASGSAYRLYAVSNTGSLLGLLAYPFFFEPLLALRSQQFAWSAGFLAFALTCVAVGARTARAPEAPEQPSEAGGGGRAGPRAGSSFFWIALSTTSSVLLLAITNQLCQEVAVVPFLWVLPLALYLLTFILCFESDRWYRRAAFLPGLFAASLLAVLALYQGTGLGIAGQIAIFAGLLFAGCMVCHGELARSRPEPRRLTSFYLATSLGGALGGAFVNFAAPVLFKHYWELHAALLAAWVCALAALARDPLSAFHGRRPRLARAAMATALLALLLPTLAHVGAPLERSVALARSFYGVVRVERSEGSHSLMHGRIIHGLQSTDPARRREPNTYYQRDSGVGLAIEHHPRRASGPLRIGVIGLGIGTIAAYGREGDRLRFYEINPDVIRLARGEGGWFSYLPDSKATIEVVPGDARLSLERELRSGGSQRFDILVLDAFTSDAIPAHLLTREALTGYLAHLVPDGVLALHLSNRFLDLPPVAFRLASDLGLAAGRVNLLERPDDTEIRTSDWVLLARSPSLLQAPGIRLRSEAEPVSAPLWTDAYTPLLRALNGPAGAR